MELTADAIAAWFDRMYPGSWFQRLQVDSGERFELVCRCWHCDLPPDLFCKVFVERFSVFTLTNWTVGTTFPQIRRLLFRKVYSCQATGKNKSKRQISDNVRTTNRNKDCNARIDIKFKKMTRHTLKKDELLRDGLNVEIKIRFVHTHSIRSVEWYTLLRCTQNTKERYLKYFEMGIPANDAKLFNEMYIRLAYYEQKRREVQLANCMINLGQTKLIHLQYSWKRANRDFKLDSIARLKKEKTAFEMKGYFLKIIENPKIIVILTPLTKKVFQKYGTEVYIESSGISGKEIQYLTTLFVPTEIGALPIGYVIHDGHTEEEYEEGFKALAASLSEFCDKPLRPKSIVTNDGEQLEELARFFPTCSVDLCPYVNLTRFWEFIWDQQNNIHEEDRKRLMNKYYEILTTGCMAQCDEVFREIMSDPSFCKNNSLVQLINGLWSIKEGWVADNKVTKIGTREKLVSMHMRMYKNTVVRRIQKFNPYVMVILLTDVIEGMYKRYLTQFSTKPTNYQPLFSIFYDRPTDFNILPLGNNEFMVQSLTELDQVCNVFTDIIFCSCGKPTDGRLGNYCTHLKAIEVEFPFLEYPIISDDESEWYTFAGLAQEIEELLNNFEKSDNYQFEHMKRKDMGNDLTVKFEDLPEEISGALDDNNDDNEWSDDDDEKLKPKVEAEVTIETDVPKKTEHWSEDEEHFPKKKPKLESKQPKSDSKKKFEPKKSKLETKKSQKPKSDDEDEIVSKGWAIMYKNLDIGQKIYAKKAIDDILFEASLGTLSRASVSINNHCRDPIEIKTEFNCE